MLRRHLFSSTPFHAQSGLVTKFGTKWKRFVREKACAKSTSNNKFGSQRCVPRLLHRGRFQRVCDTNLLYDEFVDFHTLTSLADSMILSPHQLVTTSSNQSLQLTQHFVETVENMAHLYFQNTG